MELSEKVPVAVNGCVVPSAMLKVGEVIAIDISVAAVTINVVEALTPCSVALRVTEPALIARALPVLAPAVAMSGLDEFQATWVVAFAWLPSL